MDFSRSMLGSTAEEAPKKAKTVRLSAEIERRLKFEVLRR